MSRAFMSGYKSSGGLRGSPHQWVGAFHGRMGIEAAREEVGRETPEAILGVRSGAEWPEIKAAHRKLSRLLHPDLGGNPAAFRKMQAAYEVLEYRFDKN